MTRGGECLLYCSACFLLLRARRRVQACHRSCCSACCATLTPPTPSVPRVVRAEPFWNLRTTLHASESPLLVRGAPADAVAPQSRGCCRSAPMLRKDGKSSLLLTCENKNEAAPAQLMQATKHAGPPTCRIMGSGAAA
jgi:hypothetical protein